MLQAFIGKIGIFTGGGFALSKAIYTDERLSLNSNE